MCYPRQIFVLVSIFFNACGVLHFRNLPYSQIFKYDAILVIDLYRVGHLLIWQPSNQQGALIQKIYPPLSHFDHLVLWLKTTALAPSPILFRDPLISTTKLHFIFTSLFVLQILRVWKSQSLSLTLWILHICNI
jgi:hypothetical protein